MFVIDFDDTLFDTALLKQARLQAVAALGVSEDLFWQTYQIARKSPDGMFTYSDARHAAVLAQHGFDEQIICAALEQTMIPDQLQSYLMPGAIQFLSSLRAFGKPMILLSLGDPLFQEIKVKGSGLHELFDRTFMVEAKKHDVLAELFLHESERGTWFVNDKVDETKELAALFPNMHIALRKSKTIPVEEYQQSGFPFFQTLDQVYEYITSQR